MEFKNEISEKENRFTAQEHGLTALELMKERPLVERTSSKAEGAKPEMPSLELVDKKTHDSENKTHAKDKVEDSKDHKDQKTNEKQNSGDHKSNSSENAKSHSDSPKPSAKTELKNFGEGLATGLFLSPINGITQLINHTFKAHINPIEFKDQKEMEKSAGGKIGKIAGDALSLATVSVGTGGVGGALKLGAEGAKIADAAVAGAVHGGVLTPSNDQHFWTERLKNAGTKALDKGTPEGRIRTGEEFVKKAHENQEKNEPVKKNA